MKILGAFFLFLSTIWTAQAQTAQSEFFFQADAGETFIEGHLNLSVIEHDIRFIGEQFGFSDSSLNLSFESGRTQNLSLYGRIGYGSGKIEIPGSDIDYVGLDPVNLGVKYKYDLGSGTFFGRTNLGLGILQKLDCDVDSCNRTDGSVSLAIQLGYLLNLDQSFAGFAFDYGLLSTDAKAKAGGSNDKKGGFALTAFYERVLLDMIFGGAFSYTRKGIASPQNNGLFYIDQSAADMDASFMTVKAYARVPMGEGFALLGSVSYDVSIDQSDDNLDGGTGYSANLGIRIAL